MKKIIKWIGALALLMGLLMAGQTAAFAEAADDEQGAQQPFEVAQEEKEGNEKCVEREIEECPVEFTGTVSVELVGEAAQYYGDKVKLKAIVKDANMEYDLQWQYNDGAAWHDIAGETKGTLVFEVDETNAQYGWRATLVERG